MGIGELPIAENDVCVLLAAILESALVAMLIVDRSGCIVVANQKAEELFDHSSGELLGKSIESLVPEPLRGTHSELRRSFFAELAARQVVAGRKLHALRSDGVLIPVQIALKPLDTSRAELVLVVIVAVDVDERRRLERRFEITVEAAPIAILMVDREGGIVLANREAERLYGYVRAELIGQPVEILVPPHLRPCDQAARDRFFAAPIARRMGVGQEFLGLRKDETDVPIEIGLNPVETDDGLFTLITVVEISERKRLEATIQRAGEELERRVEERTAELAHANRINESLLAGLHAQRLELERLSREDPLTRLANRRDFDERLCEEILRAQRSGMPLAVAMLDLDHFKRVNDQFGHALGDAVLREAANLLRNECRAIDAIGRYGGEEFALALPGSDVWADVS